MKSNVLFKFVVPALIIGVLIIIFAQPRQPSDSQRAAAELMLTQEEARELGIEGDTPADTLRTLVGELRHMRTQIKSANDKNDQLSDTNRNLEERSREWEKRMEQTLARANSESDAVKAEAQQLTSQMMQMMSELENKVSNGSMSDFPIGLGLEQEESKNETDIVWIDPSDGLETDTRGGVKDSPFAFPSSFKNPLDGSALNKQQQAAKSSLGSPDDSKEAKNRNDNVDPVFTIAENSTLLGSISMTALIGRVPVDGTVNDPYPFKVLLGKDNLAANGIELPEISGAVMSGTAQGDWTLSCVRGQVETITFIFEDGTIRTLPEPEKIQRNRSSSGSQNRNSITGGIGYISDPFGIPCIAGDRKSNAKEYITNNSLITAAGAAIARIFSSGGNNVQVSAGGTTITDNDQAFNAILQRGVGDIQDWVGKMYGQAFAAVYVPPHQEVAVHIDREITLDYENFGRKVKHNEEHDEIIWLD